MSTSDKTTHYRLIKSCTMSPWPLENTLKQNKLIVSFQLNQATWPIDNSNTIKITNRPDRSIIIIIKKTTYRQKLQTTNSPYQINNVHISQNYQLQTI